jgi:hypothetical protein
MNEKVKLFWKEHKEEIKTGAILVLTPVAVMGFMAAKTLNGIVDLAKTESNKTK